MGAVSDIILGPFNLGGPELIILLVILVGLVMGITRMGKKKNPITGNPVNQSNPSIYINNQAHANSPTQPSATDKLNQLKKLKDDGILTEEEYQKKKEEILRSF